MQQKKEKELQKQWISFQGCIHTKDVINGHGYKSIIRTNTYTTKSSTCLSVPQLWRQYTSKLEITSRFFQKSTPTVKITMPQEKVKISDSVYNSTQLPMVSKVPDTIIQQICKISQHSPEPREVSALDTYQPHLIQ